MNLQFPLVIAQLGNNVVSLVGTLISEIKKSKNLIDKNTAILAEEINNFFINDITYQNVYQKCTQNLDVEELNNDMNLFSAVMKYLDFFKLIYNYIDNISFWACIDVYFRFPFFCVVNNSVIQEIIIFKNINNFYFLFDLYEIWSSRIKYKKIENNTYIDIFENRQLVVEKEYKFLPLQQFDLIDRYIAIQFTLNRNNNFSFKKILKDGKVHEFKIIEVNDAGSSYVDKVLKMNNPKGKNSWINNPEYYLKSTYDEIKYAAFREYLWVIEENNSKIAAAAIYISNPKNEPTDKNGKYIFNFSNECFQKINDDNFAVLDSVMVDTEFQGIGLQRLLLMLAKENAKYYNKNCIFATVSQSNKYSYYNLALSGYVKYGDVSYTVINTEGETTKYPRFLMRLNLIER